MTERGSMGQGGPTRKDNTRERRSRGRRHKRAERPAVELTDVAGLAIFIPTNNISSVRVDGVVSMKPDTKEGSNGESFNGVTVTPRRRKPLLNVFTYQQQRKSGGGGTSNEALQRAKRKSGKKSKDKK